MAGRRIGVLDLREMLRRFRLGEGNRGVARDLGLSRNSVAKYRTWAELEGFLGGAELPPPEVIEERLGTLMLKQPGPVSHLEVHRETIVDLRSKGVEVRALHGRLQEEQGYQGSYSALLRYVRRLEPQTPEVFLRVERGRLRPEGRDLGGAPRARLRVPPRRPQAHGSRFCSMEQNRAYVPGREMFPGGCLLCTNPT